MKTIEIHRDPASGRLRFQVRDDGKVVQDEVSSHTHIRKLRHHLRHVFGKSVRLTGLGG